jgi:hypothetical protein
MIVSRSAETISKFLEMLLWKHLILSQLAKLQPSHGLFIQLAVKKR